MKIEQIYKSKNITVSRDMDPNNNDPDTCTIIEEHTTDKKLIIDDLVDELNKPYSFKLEWSLILLLVINLSVISGHIVTNSVDWFTILLGLLLLLSVWMNNKAQKAKYTSKTLVLLFTILKVDGQV